MIIINIDKAKDIAHEKRRLARAEEFKPHDEVIMKQIPGNDLIEAEAARQVIREKYSTIQANIESATDVEELKEILTTMAE
jgi:hypothetical protein